MFPAYKADALPVELHRRNDEQEVDVGMIDSNDNPASSVHQSPRPELNRTLRLTRPTHHRQCFGGVIGTTGFVASVLERGSAEAQRRPPCPLRSKGLRGHL